MVMIPQARTIVPLVLAIASLLVPVAAAQNGVSDQVGTAAQSGAGDRPNILVITVCSWRYDENGFAGYSRPTTPFLDSFAKQGVLFESTLGSSSWTKPTVTSMLTGLTPNVHRMTDYYETPSDDRRTLADEVVTIAECLREAGYATFWRSNNVHASDFFNLTQGFDDAVQLQTSEQTPLMLTQLAQWLAKLDTKQPFFGFILTADIHTPYLPDYAHYLEFCRSKPVAQPMLRSTAMRLYSTLNRKERAGNTITESQKQLWIDLYDATLRQLDDVLATVPNLLARAGRGSDTLVIIMGDHGERFFGPHGAIGHARPFMEEEIVHVPLLMQGPGVPAGLKVTKLTRSIDLYPTLVEIAGATPPDYLQGQSLLPLLKRRAGWQEVSAFASYNEEAHMLRSGSYKLHTTTRGISRLYNLESDRQEVSDLLDKLPKVTTDLMFLLKGWLAEEVELQQKVSGGDAKELSPEVLEQLRALGYID
jgi:arylsulfatase A-like enzyme